MLLNGSLEELNRYLSHYYSPDKCVLQYVFKHSAFCSNIRGRTGVNSSCFRDIVIRRTFHKLIYDIVQTGKS